MSSSASVSMGRGAGGWPAASAPFLRTSAGHEQIIAAWLIAASIVALSGVVLYGRAAVGIIIVAIVCASATEAALYLAGGRRLPGERTHAVFCGLLVALMLPPTCPWAAAGVGSAAAVSVAKWMFGGVGHFLWQPAVVGRVLVQFLFAQHLSFGQALVQSPVLAAGHLLSGDIRAAEPIAAGHYYGWRQTRRLPVADAVLVDRPVQTLRRAATGELALREPDPLTTLIRDYLPPWEDTVLGTVPGGIGESCTIALIVVGLYLIYRGYLRWQVPLTMIASAAVAAAVLPVSVVPVGASAAEPRWLPGLSVEGGLAVGALYVVYHLTSGQLLLGAFLLAGDMLAAPLTARGQAVFAAGIGVLTIFLRLYGIPEGECYWSILIMNSLVPLIDRRVKRRGGATPGGVAAGGT